MCLSLVLQLYWSEIQNHWIILLNASVKRNEDDDVAQRKLWKKGRFSILECYFISEIWEWPHQNILPDILPALHSNNTHRLLHSCCLFIGTRMPLLSWYHRNHWTNSWPSFVKWSLLMGRGRPFLLGQLSKPHAALWVEYQCSLLPLTVSYGLFMSGSFVHTYGEREKKRDSHWPAKVCFPPQSASAYIGRFWLNVWMNIWLWLIS